MAVDKREHRRREIALNLAEQQVVVDDLLDAGVDVEILSALPIAAASKPAVRGVLVRYLRAWRALRKSTTLTIISKLRTRAASSEASALLWEVLGESDDRHIRERAADTLSAIADVSDIDAVVAFVSDVNGREDRAFLMPALPRLIGERALPVLSELALQPDTRAQAIDCMASIATEASAETIRQYVDDADDWVRKRAKAALEKIARKMQT